MFGLKSYNARGSDKIQFRTTIASNTRVNSGFNFVSISFMYWSFKKRECPAGYPFFQISTLLCYDVCPDGTYPDTILDICPLCHYSCLTCSAYDVCTNCDRQQIDFKMDPLVLQTQDISIMVQVMPLLVVYLFQIA